MFGERGIEYGDVEQPTRIYDATKTRLMLEGGHEYAREAYKGMSEFSRMLARTSGARGDGNKEETAGAAGDAQGDAHVSRQKHKGRQRLP